MIALVSRPSLLALSRRSPPVFTLRLDGGSARTAGHVPGEAGDAEGGLLTAANGRLPEDALFCFGGILYIYMHIYIYVHVCTCMYMYIYIYIIILTFLSGCYRRKGSRRPKMGGGFVRHPPSATSSKASCERLEIENERLERDLHEGVAVFGFVSRSWTLTNSKGRLPCPFLGSLPSFQETMEPPKKNTFPLMLKNLREPSFFSGNPKKNTPSPEC